MSGLARFRSFFLAGGTRASPQGANHMSTESKNIEFVKDLYAAFGRGDLPYILERFAPELESFGVTAGGRARAPFHLSGKRREDVAKYFEALIGTMEPLRLEPQHYAAAG